jgi:hypothetical protein
VHGRIAVQRIGEQCARDVRFAGPSVGREEHRTTAARTEPARSARAGLVPRGRQAARIDRELRAGKSCPGNEGRPVCATAVRAMAMRDPFRGERCGEAYAAAETGTACNGRIHHRVRVIRDSGGIVMQSPSLGRPGCGW